MFFGCKADDANIARISLFRAIT